ncbi:MAG: sulfur carrier protein ThiS [Nitrospirae bacterium]|nr:sulfur carrier protein ThiS [Nitrospirota bacterium]
MRLYLNGEGREFAPNTTVANLLEALQTSPERVAVELNLRILDKQEYARTVLKEGDRLEIISFVGGGS